MKLITVATATTIFATTSAHSWLHCTKHNNIGIKADMAAAAAETPPREVDPLYVLSKQPQVGMKGTVKLIVA
jgi:hypothetical protein